ncbi:MAG TPA: hypothetical protein VME66_16600 [Candidatus Acidoferrales bacterium]|nr:hypothetical protein [Candidatus Acidoferrales bacterium]
MKARLILFTAALLAIGTSFPAAADPSPPAQLPAIPPSVLDNPYVQSVINALRGVLQTTNGNAAFGRVTYFKHFEMQVQTAPSVYREIHLHQGTVINPRGATLSPGMTVSVHGAAQGDGSLNADEIDVR